MHDIKDIMHAFLTLRTSDISIDARICDLAFFSGEMNLHSMYVLFLL